MKEKTKSLEKVVQVSKLNLIGAVTPFTWYKHLKFASGKPYLPAIIILADIVEWHKPRIIRDPYSGEVVEYRKKFKGKFLQKSNVYYKRLFGFTDKQVRDALAYLKTQKLINFFYVNDVNDNGKINGKLLVIDIFPKEILNISNVEIEFDKVIISDELIEEINKSNKKTSKKKSGAAGATRISESWEIPEIINKWIKEKGYKISVTHLREERDKFVDYWLQRSDKMARKKDWTAAFRTWVRNYIKYREEKDPKPLSSKKIKVDKCQLCEDYKQNPELKPCPFHKK